MALTFPTSADGKTTELFVNGSWITVTPRSDAQVSIARGRKNEKNRVTPTTLTTILDNADGSLSNRYPMSPYYGMLGKNILMRQTIFGLSYLKTIGASSYVSTADHASLDITGDIDIRIDLTLTDWTDVGFASKFSTPDQKSWAFYMDSTKHPIFFWSADGTASTGTVTSANPITTGDDERVTLRVTMDVDNGAGSKVITFYTGPSVDGPWTTLDSQTIAGTTSIFASTASMTIGGVPLFGPLWTEGRIYRFQLYNGIGGTLVADPKFEDMTSDSAFSDSLGRLYGLNGSQYVPNSVRCVVEVPSMNQRWDTTGTDLNVPIQGAGILRRLGQGQRPLRSAIWRENLFDTDLISLWPMNDGASATQAGSALADGLPLTIDDGAGNFTSRSINDWVEPLMTPNSGEFMVLSGFVNQNQTDTAWTGDFVFAMDADTSGSNIIVNWEGPGNANRTEWQLTLVDDSPGVLLYELTVQNVVGGVSTPTILSSSTVAIMDGRIHHARVTTSNSGANTTYQLLFDNTVIANGVTAAGWDTVESILIDMGSSTGGLVSAGQMAVFDTASGPANAANAAVVGRSGELAGERFNRLCSEEGIEHDTFGDVNLTEPMGPQKLATLLDNLYDIEDTDHGILNEARHYLGLIYQSRVSLYSNVGLHFDYSLKHLSKELSDDGDDDSTTRNDIEVTRRGGSSYRVVQLTGPKNIQSPTDDSQGVGLYDETPEVSCDLDSQLPNIANFKLRLGTFDAQPRLTGVYYDLHRQPFIADSELTILAAGLDTGDYFAIDNPKSPPMAPETLEFIDAGYTETIGNFTWEFKRNTTPAGPYEVAETDSVHRVASGGDMVLSIAADTNDTEIYVHDQNGYARWATDSDDSESADDFPMDVFVNGERMTVTDVDEGFTDTFDVAFGSDWGPNWTVVDSGATLAVSGSNGRQTQTSAGDLCILGYNTGTPNHRIRTLTTIDNGGITGANATTWHVARMLDSSNYYVLQLNWTTADLITFAFIKRVAGSLIAFSGIPGSAQTIQNGFGAGLEVGLDFAVIGANPSRLFAKVWIPSLAPEPKGWMIYAEDSDLDTGNSIGFGSRRETGNTNVNLQWQWRDAHVMTPQKLTVVRSINGMVKSHSVDDTIEVADPAYVGW